MLVASVMAVFVGYGSGRVDAVTVAGLNKIPVLNVVPSPVPTP